MSKVKTIIANEIGTDYFIGDIHGCYAAVENELKRIGFNYDIDRLISTGDLTDRGPQSHRVFEFLDKPWFHPVMGNHEAMAYCTAKLLLKAGRPYPVERLQEADENASICLDHGGAWLLTQSSEFLQELVKRYEKLPIAIEYRGIDNHLLAVVLHAEFGSAENWIAIGDKLKQLPENYVYDLEDPKRKVDPKKVAAGNLLWARQRKKGCVDLGLPITSEYTSLGTPLVVCGHSIVTSDSGPFRVKNNRYIDHGLYETGVSVVYSYSDII